MRRAGIGIAIGLGVLAVAAFALGLVMRNQADFAKGYVHDELSAKGISFTPVEGLMPSQKEVVCLTANAGKPLVTGKQAECYAKYQIGIDLTVVDGGKTYFQDHYNGYLARLEAAKAVAAAPNDPKTVALQQQAIDVQRKADDLLAGEATRGLLLTAYAFSEMADRGMAASWTCFVVAAVLLVGAVISLMLGLRSKPKGVTPPNGDTPSTATA
jgi:hypothetical protein